MRATSMMPVPQEGSFGAVRALTGHVAGGTLEAEFEALLLAATRVCQEAGRGTGGRERNTMEFLRTKGRRT